MYIHIFVYRSKWYFYLSFTRLAEQGYKVVGVELSAVALKKFLTDHQLEHKVTTTNNGATIYEVTTQIILEYI